MNMCGTNVSCGVHQVYGLYSDGVTRLVRMLQVLSTTEAPYTSTIVFSDADDECNGSALEADIIAAFGADRLVKVSAINPNSGRCITTWLWAPDWEAVSRWMDKQKAGKERLFGKSQVKRIMVNYRDGPDSGECDCDECREARGESDNDD